MDVSPAASPSLPARFGHFLRDHTFRSLKHRNYRLYFFGQIVSFTGSWIQNAALMWLVFDRTNDPIWPPLLLVAQVGPTLLLGTLGGALADRWPKKRLVLITQSLFLMNALALTLLLATDRVEPLIILGLQLANGVVQSLDLPTRLAFVPDLVPRVDLINAVSLNSLLFNCARAIGPAVAGLLFALSANLLEAGWFPGRRAVNVGAMWCFSLNSLSYAAVLMALWHIDCPGERVGPRPESSTWDGIRYVLARRNLAGLLLFTGLFSALAWPALSLFPAYTRLALGYAEQEYSMLVSGLGSGALVAALLNASFGNVSRRRFFLGSGAGLAAVGLGGLALVQTLPGATGMAALLGFGLVLYLSTGQSAMQLSVTDDVRGRVMALWAITLSVSAPVGHLLAGFAATIWPVRSVLIALALGVVLLAAATASLVIRRTPDEK